ncbi:predicted protein [Histoplasma capsulatum G186AR]|uniref:N-acetyltransferase domain-containing protein n=1 Tax=Ajellomyces capsulatus (strain G186AR / H82 / ATCC MYA-2454 / RMSCC 2432) TaxID=447093 RepID=C0NAI2_AJECG|nr:uncharacterized protein HCBG_00128 [Histoplasma capsulatum G186AR]EEH10673.1 predicted protein [Histoplasma capsulatum G186AR]
MAISLLLVAAQSRREIELMIAEKAKQGKGYGRAGRGTVVVGEGKLAYLSAKIGAGNARSLGLFLSLGFTKVSDEPNVFGEVELRRGGLGGDEGGQLLRRCGVEEYMEGGL